MPPLKFHTGLLTPRNVAFGFDDEDGDSDESMASLPEDGGNFSDEEVSGPSNFDYLERPISQCYDEEELFGCKVTKPQGRSGILKKGLANENLTIEVPDSVRRFTDGELGFKKCVQKKLTPGGGGVQLQKQVHLRNLNCLDDPIDLATPPSAPPITDDDFPVPLGPERDSVGSVRNEQTDSWPSRESVGGRSECSVEQKPKNVKAAEIGERYFYCYG